MAPRDLLFLFFVSLAPAGPVDVQDTSVVPLVQHLFEAASFNRAGETARAAARLEAMSLGEHRKAIDAILARRKRHANGPPSHPDDIRWSPPLVRALAALEMELALAARTSQRRDANAAAAHTSAGSALYQSLARSSGKRETSAARWYLAMGLEELADGRFEAAERLLLPACRDFEPYAPLLLACGTVHETFSAFPYDAGGTVRHSGGWSTDRSSRPLEDIPRARTARERELKAARTFFERASTADPADTQAPLRLANVRMRQGSGTDAAALLVRLLARAGVPTRDVYLAQLFLGRAHEQHGRFEDAAAAYDAAIAVIPAQSALLARAHNAQRRGNASEAATFVERATASGGTDDPWWAYRFGQYWLTRDIYIALRAEARQ
ncbi:MAG TPA: hypothetical protein VNJ04_03910 [Gemmatimonadaceae bacterium]|nr:hypothetical protein [Gemmatimonadaceae bacterium]